MLAIVIRAILSWIPYNESIRGVYNFFEQVTKPIMDSVYKITADRLILSGFDLTPMVAYFLLYALKRIILSSTFLYYG